MPRSPEEPVGAAVRGRAPLGQQAGAALLAVVRLEGRAASRSEAGGIDRILTAAKSRVTE